MHRLYVGSSVIRRALPTSTAGARLAGIVNPAAGESIASPSQGSSLLPVDHASTNTATTTTTSHQRLQYRFIDARKKRKRRKAKDPFKVLGVPESILYKDVKKKFLQIAMKNHPDTIGGDVTDEERDKMRDIFINARIAFESLTEDSDGTAIRVEDVEDAMENFDSWFKDETGFDTPFNFDMDPETMKEVASMTEKIGGGLDRDGGMWALARMVTSTVKSGGDAATVLRLEAGEENGRNRQITGVLRRRRKR